MSLAQLPAINDTSALNKSVRLRKISRLGGGTYGKVYQASTDTNAITGSFPTNFLSVANQNKGQMISVPFNESKDEIVAVKQNFVSRNFCQTIGSLRELDILNLVKGHPYCIQLKDVTFEVPFVDGSLSPPGERDWVPDKVFFVLEKGDLDGDKYIRGTTPRLVNERKLFAVQILLGVEYLHSRGVYHCDLKPQNIICFLNSNGELDTAKITDFGLAQYYSKQSMSIPGIVTLWYRAPEISLTKEYDYKVDVWSLGCILFELFSSGNRRFMTPNTDEALINNIIERLYFPPDDYMLASSLFPTKITRSYEMNQKTRHSIEIQLGYTQSQVAQFNSNQLGGKPNSGTFSQLVDLLEHMLVVNPNNRYTVSQCLNHPFFEGYRELIDHTRTSFGINSEGEWVLQLEPILKFQNNTLRKRGMQWFNIIYANRLKTPICHWYSHRIFFHALEMFDRYLVLANPSIDTPECDLVVWINTFMFMSAKYFRIMVSEYGLNYFATGIYADEFLIFNERVETFEEHVVRDVFKYNIYQSTIYEIADDFLTETSIALLIKIILQGQIPNGISLKNLWSMYADSFNQANRISSPNVTPQTPVISLANKASD